MGSTPSGKSSLVGVICINCAPYPVPDTMTIISINKALRFILHVATFSETRNRLLGVFYMSNAFVDGFLLIFRQTFPYRKNTTSLTPTYPRLPSKHMAQPLVSIQINFSHPSSEPTSSGIDHSLHASHGSNSQEIEGHYHHQQQQPYHDTIGESWPKLLKKD